MAAKCNLMTKTLATLPVPPYTAPSSGSGSARIAGFTLIRQINGNPKGAVWRRRKGSGMKAEELKGKTPDQLRDSLVALKKEAFNLRFQAATNQLTNTSRIKAVRRDAARVKTVLNQKAAQAAAN